MATIDPASVKQHLVGLGPWLDAAAALPAPYTYNDANIGEAITSASLRFQRETQFTVDPVQVWSYDDGTNPTATDPVTNAPYENLIIDEPYDFYQEDACEYFRVRLKRRPVLQVQRLRVLYGAPQLGQGQSQQLYDIPAPWINLKQRSGITYVIPTYGTLSLTSAATAGFAFLGAVMGNRNYLPNSVAVDYVAGLSSNWYDSYEWSDLRRCIEQCAAVQVLDDISDMADAGLLSVTVSGANTSETRQYDRFKPKKERLEKLIDRFKATLTDSEEVVAMGWV